MKPMKHSFRPQADALYMCLGFLPVLAIAFAFVMNALWPGVTQVIVIPPAILAVAVIVLVLLACLVLGTKYSILENGVYVKFAIFWRVTIPYCEITRVQKVDSVQASSALSRHRIRILWKDQSVPWEHMRDLSPRQEAHFLSLLKRHVKPEVWNISENGEATQ
jgi:hypothetical protein